MPNLSKYAVCANEALVYALIAPILPHPQIQTIGQSIKTIYIDLSDGSDEKDELTALVIVIRDLILRRHGLGSAIKAKVPQCLEKDIDISSLPSNSIYGWHESCVCGQCDP
ncbi:hypothetical protein DL93DRAFT_2076276 [Clavulina sp. PMI_390]|nr:hypothetical protein DL93DRAFT_2076276 [Clavulina sp. PMI_390]